jgi:hypothetical protein
MTVRKRQIPQVRQAVTALSRASERDRSARKINVMKCILKTVKFTKQVQLIMAQAGHRKKML